MATLLGVSVRPDIPSLPGEEKNEKVGLGLEIEKSNNNHTLRNKKKISCLEPAVFPRT
jgi:hypothetical protein